MIIARGIHLFPFRTEKLSLVTPMILRNSGKVGSCQLFISPVIFTDSRAIFLYLILLISLLLLINYFKCHFHFFTAKTFLIHLFPCQISSVQPVPDAISSVIFLSIHHKCTIWVGYHVHYIFTHIDSFFYWFKGYLLSIGRQAKGSNFRFLMSTGSIKNQCSMSLS